MACIDKLLAEFSKLLTRSAVSRGEYAIPCTVPRVEHQRVRPAAGEAVCSARALSVRSGDGAAGPGERLWKLGRAPALVHPPEHARRGPGRRKAPLRDAGGAAASRSGRGAGWGRVRGERLVRRIDGARAVLVSSIRAARWPRASSATRLDPW